MEPGRYKVHQLPQPSMLLTVINPVIALNELLLGQRFATRMLLDTKSDRPFVERVYLQCKVCETLHSASLWRNAALGNWFGLVCPNCETKIPTLLNVFSILVAIPTAPLWYPVKLAFAKTLHRRQLARLRDAARGGVRPLSFGIRSAATLGAFFASGLFAAFLFLPQILRAIAPEHAGRAIEPSDYLPMGFICALGGIAMGFFVHALMNRKPRNRSGVDER